MSVFFTALYSAIFPAYATSGCCTFSKRYLLCQATGEDFSVEPADSRRPFRALLDVGLIRTTTGNRVFGALKVS